MRAFMHKPQASREPVPAKPLAVRTRIAESHSSGFAHDFSRIRLHSQPDDKKSETKVPATKEPPYPKPQKGEKPLPKITIKLEGGREEDVYASFVPDGLWWFNGATPTFAPLYPQTADIPVDSLGKGDLTAKVAAGADKVAFDGGGSTLKGKDLTKITVHSRGASTKRNDVKIEVTHHAPGAKMASIGSTTLEVRAPHHLELLGTDHSAVGALGFLSFVTLRVFDNFNEPMPYINVNEDFDKGVLEKGTSADWKDPIEHRHKGNTISRGNAVFNDSYRLTVSGTRIPPGMAPVPSNPGSPLGKAKAGSFTHDWYAGSPDTGKGVHVSRHTGVFYADHGEYTAFTSPPAAAKAPTASPTKPAVAPKTPGK